MEDMEDSVDMKLYVYEEKADEIIFITTAEADEFIGDAFFSVKRGGELFGRTFEEIEQELETNGIFTVGLNTSTGLQNGH